MTLSPEQALFAVVLNAVLLLIGIPVAVWGIKAIVKLIKSVDALNLSLVGYGETGGLIDDVKSLRKRVHKQESLTSALLIHTGLEAPPEGRSSNG